MDTLAAMGYDGRTIVVGDHVRHCTGGWGAGPWVVWEIRDDGTGRYSLSLVNPDNPNHRTAFYADRAVRVGSEGN